MAPFNVKSDSLRGGSEGWQLFLKTFLPGKATFQSDGKKHDHLSGNSARKSQDVTVGYPGKLLVPDQEGPDDPGRLVGQGHGGLVGAPFVLEPTDPAPQRVGPAIRQAHDGPGSVDQERAERPVAPLRDPSQPVLAAARVLVGHQSQPGGQMPAVFEERDPRNPGESLTRRVGPMDPEDPVVEPGDPFPDLGELVRKKSEHLPGDGRERRVPGIQEPGESRGGLRNTPGKHDPNSVRSPRTWFTRAVRCFTRRARIDRRRTVPAGPPS